MLRTDQSLDRKDLADRAGISYSYLAAIENGKKPPSSKVLFAIAGALGLLSHELLASVETRFRRQHQPGGRAPLRRSLGAPGLVPRRPAAAAPRPSRPAGSPPPERPRPARVGRPPRPAPPTPPPVS